MKWMQKNNKKGKGQNKNSVFQHLIIMFLSAMLLVYFSVLAVFGAYIRQQQSIQGRTLRDTVNHTAASLEDQLEVLHRLEGTILRDDRISKLASDRMMNGYEVSQAVREISDMIIGFESLNSLIDKIRIIIPIRAMSISDERGYSRYVYTPSSQGPDSTRRLLYTFRNGHSGQSVPEDGQIQEEKNQAQNLPADFLSLDDEESDIYMELMYPLSYSVEEDYMPDYGIQIQLSKEVLKQELELYKTDGDSGAFFILENHTEEPLILAEETEGRNGKLSYIYSELKDLNLKEKSTSYEEGTKLYSSGIFGKHWFVTAHLPEFGLILVSYRSRWTLLHQLSVPLLMLTAILLAMTFIILRMVRHTSKRVMRPLRKIAEASEQITGGNLYIRIFHEPEDEFQYIYDAFNTMTSRIQELIENEKEQAKLLQNAELIQLQSQINPHFLYNSFHLIRIMARNEDYDQIMEFVTSLAKYYRFLNKETENTVPLEREAEHMQNYMDIQQMRFSDKISVDVESVPVEVRHLMVPKLILQPLIENAYNYGMKQRLDGGLIRVRYEIVSEDMPDSSAVKESAGPDSGPDAANRVLHIIVDDNGGEVSEDLLESIRHRIGDYEGEAAGHALTNINRRLRLSFGESGGLHISSNDIGGFRSELIIPLLDTMQNSYIGSTTEKFPG